MIEEFARRRVLATTLDPLPRGFRTATGCVAINLREIAALEREYTLPRGSARPVFKTLIDIVQAQDELDMIAATRRKKTK